MAKGGRKGGRRGPFRVILAGNPNSGKSTVFNALTGSRQHTGNWPGKTVERKEGPFARDGKEFSLVDLPGAYSLVPYSPEEEVSSQVLLSGKYDVIVYVLDATNLERSLYFLTQILDLGKPVVLDLNMADELERSGMEIEEAALSARLGITCVRTSALQGVGFGRLEDAIAGAASRTRARKVPPHHTKDVRAALGAARRALKLRSATDWKVLSEIEKSSVPAVSRVRERAAGSEPFPEFVIRKRYEIAKDAAAVSVRKGARRIPAFDPRKSADAILTDRFLGIPAFLLIMYLAFMLVFGLGTPLGALVSRSFGLLSAGVVLAGTAAGAPAWLLSLAVDGVIRGVGIVVSFLPNVLLMYLALGLLEDTGYLSRAVYVMERLAGRLGIGARSVIPMLLGFGCNVPAIMATRTIESARERRIAIAITPFMSCTARLPIYVVFSSVFFPGREGIVIFVLYLLGIAVGLATARFLNSGAGGKKPGPLVIELPPYRMPKAGDVLRSMWWRGRSFLRKAYRTILAASVLIWLLGSLPWGVPFGSEGSLVGVLGKAVAPFLSLAGFGSWKAGVALTFGIVAKEVVVSTLGQLYPGEALAAGVARDFSPLSAGAFMIMSLLYIPCAATVSVIRSESGSWKAAAMIFAYTLAVGWLSAVAFYQAGLLLGFR